MISTPQPSAKSHPIKHKIVVIECARGFAAVYVLIHHFIASAISAETYQKWEFAFDLFSYHRQAVLLFFLLSGFSIQFSSRNRPLWSKPRCLDFYYLRLRRIYPLFLVATGMTIILLGLGFALNLEFSEQVRSQLAPTRLLATLSFLTDKNWPGHWFDVLPMNLPVWSLSYEVPYYLVYPLFWRGAKSFGIAPAFLASVGISVLFAAIDCAGIHNHLSNVFSLYWLWCAGALLAEWRARGRTFQIPIGLFCCVFYGLFAGSQLAQEFAPQVCSDWLWGLLLLAVMFSYEARFSKAGGRAGMAALVALPVLMELALFPVQTQPVGWNRDWLKATLVASAAFTAVLIMGWFSLPSCCKTLLRPFYRAGTWSYGLYITHYPCLIFTAAVLAKFHLQKILLLAVIPFLLWLARWLELNLQPAMVRWMDAHVRRRWDSGLLKSTGPPKNNN